MSTDTQAPPAAPSVTGRNDLAFRFPPRYRVVWVSLALLVTLTLLTAPEVFHTDSMSLVTALTGVLAIAAAGQLLVIMSGGIDLSVPAVVTMAAAVVVHQSNGVDSRLAGAIVEVIAICALIGLINGFLVAVVRLNAMIVTLAMTGVIAGILVIWIGTTFSLTGAVPKNLSDLAGERVGFMSVIAIIGAALIFLLAFLLRSSSPGRSYVAAGTNRVAAEIIGVRVVWYEMAGYILAAIFYGIAGIFLAGLLGSPDISVGDPYQLATIIAVALGGAALAGGPASLLCTIGGCFFVALLGQYLQAQSYSAGVSQIVNGVVLIFAVALVTAGAGGRFRGLKSLMRR